MIDDVEVRDAGAKGKGVFARRDFGEGEFIFRRRHGLVVDEEGVAALSAVDRMHLCELGWNRFAVLLAPGCYLNHSCDPNAMRSGVKVFAWRAIRAGDEITIDYRLNAFDGDSWPCMCGAASCSGTVVGSFFALPDERQRRYLRYAPGFISQEYRRRQRSMAPRGGKHEEGWQVAAYVILDIETTDPATMAAYREAAPPSVAVHGGRYLARGGEVESLEGGWSPQRIVVLEFDSIERAKVWWNSAEYREPKLLRRSAGKSKVILVDGV